MKRIILVTMVLIAAACSSNTPVGLKPDSVRKDEITCRSGYHIATREDGTQFCEVDINPTQ